MSNPTEPAIIILQPATNSRLESLCHSLQEELGFPVSVENAILWMLKQVNVPTKPPLPYMIAAQDAANRGNKIEAIKIIREHTSMSLKEAKDFVEAQFYGPGS